MKVRIGEDEWYPVFSLHKTDNDNYDTVDIPDELYERYENALAEFEEVQNIISDLY